MTDEEEALVLVYSTYDVSDGMLAKTMLEANGIGVFIKGSAADQAYPTGGSFLWVNPADEAAAKELLREANAGELRDDATEEAESAAEEAEESAEGES